MRPVHHPRLPSSASMTFTDALGDDKCDVSHPSIPNVRCALRVGHGSRHAGSTREGEGHAWD